MLVENAELERLIVETHSTVATLVERSIGIENKLLGVQHRQDTANHATAKLQQEQYRQDGALGALRWLLTILLSVTGAGAAIAGVVLAIVAQ